MSVQMATTLSTNCNWWYCVRTAKATFPYWNFCFWVPFLKQLLLKNYTVNFVEICNVCTRKAVIKAAKRIFNSDKICRSYCDFYFGVTFLEHSVVKLQRKVFHDQTIHHSTVIMISYFYLMVTEIIIFKKIFQTENYKLLTKMYFNYSFHYYFLAWVRKHTKYVWRRFADKPVLWWDIWLTRQLADKRRQRNEAYARLLQLHTFLGWSSK